MYEYKYVDVILESVGLFSKKKSDYREIIDSHAKEGWRFVQLIPKCYNSDGRPWEFEVIFEKEVSD